MAPQHRDRRVQTPDEPQRLAVIECAICDAWVEVYRCRQGDEKSSIEWQIRDDAELCRHPPPHNCPQARIVLGAATGAAVADGPGGEIAFHAPN